MSSVTFGCIVITTERGAALMFAVKLAKNFEKFSSKKICVRLETFKLSQHKKSKKNFFSGQIGL